jgi:hypothetical protein
MVTPIRPQNNAFPFFKLEHSDTAMLLLFFNTVALDQISLGLLSEIVFMCGRKSQHLLAFEDEHNARLCFERHFILPVLFISFDVSCLKVTQSCNASFFFIRNPRS